MTSIKLKFNSTAGDSQPGRLYYQIVSNRKTSLIRSDHWLYPREWDYKNNTLRASGTDLTKPPSLSTRRYVTGDIKILAEIDKNLLSEGISYNAGDIALCFRRFNKTYSLQRFMGDIIRKLRQRGKIRTSETYRATLSSFTKFLNQYARLESLRLDMLSPETIQAYQAWLLYRGLSLNSVSFYMRVLRAVYNRAAENPLIENLHPFRKVYTGVGKTIKRALRLDVIAKIRNLPLSDYPRLAYARDMFMISFYLRGMSFIDMAFLKKSDLRDGCLTYRRRKTGQTLMIAWTKEMQQIVDRYPPNPTDYLLPIICKPAANPRGIYRYMGYNINRGLKQVAAMAGITMPLTLYVARHSWASAAKAKGVPLRVISEGMGHDSESTTQIYLASLDTLAIDRANSMIIASLQSQTN